MTAVDQNSRVPALDAAAMSRLADALDRPEVVTAFLIGSQARRSAGPLSDVDVAILHDPGLTPRERLDLRLSLASSAGAALGTSEVDIVLLNGAPPLLRHRAIRDGVRLLDHRPEQRIEFEVRTLNDYVDTEPLRRLLSRRLRGAIEEDRFGRRT
ncbi:MAG: type VII toxin-antitoxin system MntA family adenylyltransferase antitoxin [Solirubrobacterales bacterium]